MGGERVKGPSPHLIMYSDAIDWSLGRGMACDFGGAPTAGIRDFKVRMGCVTEHCVSAERIRPKSYRAARRLHARIASRRGANRLQDVTGTFTAYARRAPMGCCFSR
jgi:hypothetical protein